jgi:hypothetical protein
MASQWCYQDGSNIVGPLSSSELKALAISGDLTQQQLVSRDGAERWARAGDVRGLFPSAEIVEISPGPLEQGRRPVKLPDPRIAAKKIAQTRAEGFVEARKAIDFCCHIFEDAVGNQGEPGSCIVLGRLDSGEFVCELEYRAVAAGAEVPISGGQIMTHVTQPIGYCPWCGVDLEEFYGQMALSIVKLIRF